ncbi:MAG: winged helix-turn-helix transcriptional regulator, partial [Peptostreptococcaceae bacterium]
KIESIIKQYNITTITPNELAEFCGVSTRSINRIITKLEDKGYIRIVGKKTNTSNGRPSRLIEIDFNSNFKVY